ncbi:protein kinase domain-containing protein [Sulfuracidifex tepidarius]|uniref:non-specific serine/threonine protein kinase n=1 Tax=Sulfuracidifex tepidarius TaxID=1294262 RepID=A0A510E1Q0_9CREN|nr:protein kinase [Sulfuracidifex tepidarius]BBG26018.1 hypothetical protein IC007_0523 [Sulfuracidifex tepidarius]
MASVKPDVFKAKRLYCSGYYSDAYSAIKSALSLFPVSDEASAQGAKYVYADILRWKGILEIKVGMLDQAINTLEDVIQTLGYEPHEVTYYQSLARYYYSYFVFNKKKVLVPALRDLKYVVNSVTQKCTFRTLLALVHAELDELYDAELVIKGGNMTTKIAESHVYLKKGDLLRAHKTIDQLLMYEKDNVDALLEKSLILMAKGSYKDSLDLLEEALRLEPSNVLASLFKAEVLEVIKRQKDALSIYKSLDNLLNSPVVKSRIAGITLYNPPPPPVLPFQAQSAPPWYSSSPAPHVQTSNTQKTQATQATSNPLVHSKLLTPTPNFTWDPKVWVGRKFSVYKIESVLGEGGNGYVLKARAFGGVEAAVKVLKVYPGISEDYFSTLVNEASNLSSLSKRPNVVEIYAVNVDKLVLREIISGNTSLYERDPPRIIMEFMRGGTLGELVMQDMFFYSSKWSSSVYKAISTTAEALHQMHASGFVHMDVKPQNVFLTEKPKDPSELGSVEFKLGDLGSAVRVTSKITQFTPEYAPPEVYVDAARPFLDVFSLGVTMYVLLTRKIDRPDLQEMDDAFNCFQKNDMKCVKEKVKEAQDKLRGWDPSVPAEVKQLLKRMVDPEPLKRPTSLQVYEELRRIKT